MRETLGRAKTKAKRLSKEVTVSGLIQKGWPSVCTIELDPNSKAFDRACAEFCKLRKRFSAIGHLPSSASRLLKLVSQGGAELIAIKQSATRRTDRVLMSLKPSSLFLNALAALRTIECQLNRIKVHKRTT